MRVLERGAPRPPGAFTVASARHPLLGHYARPEDEAVATAVLAALEHAWDVQVDQIGFSPPVPDTVDGPELDFYFVAQDPYYAWTAGDAYEDAFPGDGRSSTAAYIVFSRDLPADVLDAYVAHEFNHILQWATDFTEPTLPIWEGTATAAQTWTLGEAGDWAQDVPSFQEVPWAPTLLSDGYVIEPNTGLGAYFEYGAALWVMHLDQLVGGGGEGGRLLWENAASEGPNEPDVVDGAIAIAGSFPELMNGIARSRWLVGDWWVEDALQGAADWGPDYVPPVADDPGEVWIPADLFVTGQAFARFDVRGSEGALELDVESASGLESALAVFWRGPAGSGETTGFPVQIQTAGVDEVVAVVTNLGPPGWDGDDNPYDRGDQRLVSTWLEPEPERRACGCTAGRGGWSLRGLSRRR